MKVAFHTLGCKVNSYESQAMLNMFEEAGYEEVDFKEVADVYVVNTCTVTNTGDSKSRQMIRKAIRKNPQATVCVVGCYSQVAPQDIEAIEGVSIILGTQFRNEIVDLVEKYQQTHERIVKVSEVKQLRKFEDLNIDRFLHTRAYLKIQDGCNNFCTYCIIPYARGRVRSRKPESVIKQAKELVAKGYVEIVLTGIHTAGYGEDLENYSFYDLLVDSDGVTTVDVTNYGTPYSGVRIDVDEADGWWGGTMWYYDGYETLDELYQEAVTDNLESYKHEDNVNEKLAAASETQKAKQENKEESNNENDSEAENGMIFPDSSTVEINSEDLKKLSDEELRYAVNEIYARHGYIFKDDQLRTYYEQYDWYKETVKPEDFSDSVFNETEKRNIQTLQRERDARNN